MYIQINSYTHLNIKYQLGVETVFKIILVHVIQYYSLVIVYPCNPQ